MTNSKGVKIKTEIIRTYIARNNLSKSSFCRQCKIGYNTLNKIFNDDERFRITVLLKISKALGIQIQELFE